MIMTFMYNLQSGYLHIMLQQYGAVIFTKNYNNHLNADMYRIEKFDI